MPDIAINDATLIQFMGVFFRIVGILIWLPILGESQVPAIVKIGLGMLLAIIIFPTLALSPLSVSNDIFTLAWFALKEGSIGLILGLISKTAFYGVLMAAQFVGYQMGFGTASIFDPNSGSQISPFSQFQNAIAVLVFLVFNFHHFFIETILQSFDIVSLGAIRPSPEIAPKLAAITGSIFTVGVKLAAPVLTSLMFTMVALGLIARTVPQVNVFVLSFPISSLTGFAVFVVSISYYSSELRLYFEHFSGEFLTILKLMK